MEENVPEMQYRQLSVCISLFFDLSVSWILLFSLPLYVYVCVLIPVFLQQHAQAETLSISKIRESKETHTAHTALPNLGHSFTEM